MTAFVSLIRFTVSGHNCLSPSIFPYTFHVKHDFSKNYTG